MIKHRLRNVDTGKLLAAWRRVRTTSMVISGLGCVDYGVYQASHVAGWISIGVSILVMDWLSDDEEAAA